ncbi:MAG: phosphate ABC transporter substrate-binding protein PstS [bacterium]
MKRLFLIFLTMLLLSGYSSTRAQSQELSGAGATFPYPLYSKMFDEYNRQFKVKVNYQAIGSGGGLKRLLEKTVDFGASDAFLSDEKLKMIPDEILHIPICLGAVSITHNLPGNPELKFTPDLLSDIFLGKVTRWDQLQAVNPGVKLPALNIVVVHRSDESGTTFILTDYLSKVNHEWNEKIGRDKSIDWPTGLGAKGNGGVAGLLKQFLGSIGYVEIVYALSHGMPAGSVKNRSGIFVKPNLDSTSLAANIRIPDDTRVSITDTDASDGYPISSFTWILLYKEQDYQKRSLEQAERTVKLLWWMTHEGQEYIVPNKYAPLPKAAVEKAENIIKSISYKGKPVLH